MFVTPPTRKKVNTRSNTVRKEQEKRKVTATEQAVVPSTSDTQNIPEQMNIKKTVLVEPGNIKSEIPVAADKIPISRKCSSLSKKSSSSSVQARRKRLELEAAEAKAKIEMQLIDKRLEAELADLDDEYSPPSETDNRSDVANWVERSQLELETQPATKQVESLGLPRPPANLDAGTDGPIQQLANVLKDFMTTAVNNNSNANLLSRMSTSRDLPVFAGDPMEWLQFKMAYDESNRVCQFSDAENLYRLRRCLRGPAKDAVTALLITAASPETLLSTLELQFGNPDEIISRIMLEIKKLHGVSPEYHKDIVMFSNKIKNYVAAVRALGRQGFLEDTSLVTVVLSKLPTILLSKWADYRYSHNTSATTRLDLLAEFLHEEAVKISQCSVTLINTPKDNNYFKRKYIDNSANYSQTILLQSGQSDTMCRYCHVSNHNLTDCKKFKKSLRKDRWSFVKRFNLCYKCLLRHNDWHNCPAPVCDVINCGAAHHRLLHFVPSNKQNNNESDNQNSGVQVTEIESETSSQVVAHMSETERSSCRVLLKVVPINIHGPAGVTKTCALLDDGSTVSLISDDLMRRVGARGRRDCMRVRGAWDNTELVCDTYLVDLTLSNKNGQLFTISARSVSQLNLPKQNTNIVNCDKFNHLRNLKGYLNYGELKPEILIGQDNYHLMLPLEVVASIPREPCATRTPLGWCLHGRTPVRMKHYERSLHSTMHVNEVRVPPGNVVQPEIKEHKLKHNAIIQTPTNNLPVPEPTRFSSWLRLLRSTHAVLKFIKKCRKLTNDVDHGTMEPAERLLLRYSQAQTFGDEINDLKKGKQIHKSSKLLTLSPYLDEHGVLRLGGRIDNAADVLPETKRPAIIDGQDYITKLIVKYYHTSAAHGNQETVVNNLKQKYWIIKLRPTVKNIVSRCMLCRLRKCKPEIPRMGDLPPARVAHHQRPFTYCGVDLFGPMDITIGRRRERRYGVLFTCLTVRAIHIEVVASLTTDSFIMALRRMAARRGWPQHIFSDNGTNLRGADAELKRAAQELDKENLASEAMNNGTKWTFIPAASPHWGGAWERMIRSVKSSLKVILKERAPREETLMTLLAEVESIVNSRPLTHVSVNPGSQETLTPNHFLLGSSSNLPHLGSFDDSELYLRKQWRIAQRLADLYWKRWLKEVLPDMLPRKKWNKEQRPLQEGDLVLVIDPDGPRNIWPRGIIAQVLPGKDGRVRMVNIRTKTGVLTRSAARVARLPVDDECC